MKLENSVINNKDITTQLHGDVLEIYWPEIDTEYAVIITGSNKTEQVAAIIEESVNNIKMSGEKIEAVSIVNIYTDEKVFQYEMPKDENEIPKEEIIPVSHTQGDNPSVSELSPAPQSENTLPPPLITKKKDTKKKVYPVSDFSYLKKFDNFDCRLPEHEMYVFDEDILREKDAKVSFNGQRVPAWFPYLSYTDKMVSSSPLPRRIIGEMVINSVRYITYGVLCDIKKSNQPFFGATGFVYLVPSDGDFGYWLMYLDSDTGEICFPYDEEYMSKDN